MVNAKTHRPGVCNAAETLLVHREVAGDFLPGWPPPSPEVTLLGDAATRAVLPDAGAATEEDFATEFLGPAMAVAVVDDLDGAIDHIARFGSGHSEAIVTGDLAAANRFTAEVDAAAVLVNASTRFIDGEELGLGAEIGISTQKLHARGPMGLRELTSVKYVVPGRRAGAGMTGVDRPAGRRRDHLRLPGGRAAPVRLHRRRPPGPGRGRLPGRRRASPGCVFLADRLAKPVLVEGPAGTGKTELAKSVARLTGSRLIRLQCYEGLDESKALYEWNYKKQLLRIQADSGQAWEELEEDIFSEEFLLTRPAARGDPVARAGGAAGRRGRPGRARDRGAAPGDPLRVPGVHPGAGHGAGHADPPGLPHLEQHPGAVGGPEAPVPLPAHRLPPARPRAGHHRDPGAGDQPGAGRPGRPDRAAPSAPSS